MSGRNHSSHFVEEGTSSTAAPAESVTPVERSNPIDIPGRGGRAVENARSTPSMERPVTVNEMFLTESHLSWPCNVPAEESGTYSDDDMTVGVEWEFLLDPESLPPFPTIGTPYPVLDEVARCLHELNVKAGVDHEVYHALNNVAYGRNEFPDVDHSLPPRLRFKDYFIVGFDGSVKQTRRLKGLEKRRQWVGIEIASPAVGVKDIPMVMKTFLAVKERFRIRVNTTCGLHVHVGHGDRGFPLPWLRNVGALCWAASPIVDELHPAHRGPGAPYAPSLRYFTKLGHTGSVLEMECDGAVGGEDDGEGEDAGAFGYRRIHPLPGYDMGPQPDNNSQYTDWPGPDLPDHPEVALRKLGLSRTGAYAADRRMGRCGLARLLAAETTTEVLMLLSAETSLRTRLAYNFNNLRDQGDAGSRRPRTMEFRQHAGTTSMDEMAAWMEVCVALVQFARPRPVSPGFLGIPFPGSGPTPSPTSDHVVRVAWKAVRGGELCHSPYGAYDVYDLLADIGAHEPAKFYLERQGLSTVQAHLAAGNEEWAKSLVFLQAWRKVKDAFGH